MTARYDKAWGRLGAGDLLILDGGVSTELERRGVAMDPGLWSGRAALDAWEGVVDLHRAYIDAGADVITANTYAASRLMLAPAGLGEQVETVNRRAIEAALTARERAGAPEVLVAGSLSHMIPVPAGGGGAPKAGGPGALAQVAAFHELATLHEAAGADLLLLEMMSLPERMAAMFEALADSGLPVWCGLSAQRGADGSLRSWHDPEVAFTEIVEMAARPGFDVLGIMHTAADLVAETLPPLGAAHPGPLMAYPDAGHLEMPHWHFVDSLPPARFAAFAQTWRDAGVQIIGGCCGLGPEHIAAIAGMKGTRG